MANTSVDGLISGLGTSDVISQLLQLERQPQLRLQSQKSALATTTSAYQGLNTRFDAVLQAATALATKDGAAWSGMKATSSDPAGLLATARAGALPADLAVSVERLATAHTMVSETSVAGLDTAVATGPITFTIDGTPTAAVAVGSGSLKDVVTAINGAGVGVKAAAVQVSPGQYRLQLTATATGETGRFTVDPGSLDGLADPSEVVPDADAFNVLTLGVDAELRVGGAGGYPVTSSTNRFVDLLPGVDLTAVKAAPGTLISVGVAPDVDGMTAGIEKLVTAVNAALGFINDQSTYNPETKVKGPLLGNSLARQLQQRLFGALGLDLPNSSLGDIGLKLGAKGLELDKAALAQAYASDPAKVVEAFTGAATVAATDGLATKLVDLGNLAAKPTTGLVALAITAMEDRARTYTRDIEAWDVRLASREATLRRQYAAMETALGTLKNQSTWLAGQISGLPAWE
ncbi:MAG: flagellar filament capping protein FliD [Actinomycetota bacterium]|nr:flagellar filament capping protein FliD [Actinomycetota bacterium]